MHRWFVGRVDVCAQRPVCRRETFDDFIGSCRQRFEMYYDAGIFPCRLHMVHHTCFFRRRITLVPAEGQDTYS